MRPQRQQQQQQQQLQPAVAPAPAPAPATSSTSTEGSQPVEEGKYSQNPLLSQSSKTVAQLRMDALKKPPPPPPPLPLPALSAEQVAQKWGEFNASLNQEEANALSYLKVKDPSQLDSVNPKHLAWFQQGLRPGPRATYEAILGVVAPGRLPSPAGARPAAAKARPAGSETLPLPERPDVVPFGSDQVPGQEVSLDSIILDELSESDSYDDSVANLERLQQEITKQDDSIMQLKKLMNQGGIVSSSGAPPGGIVSSPGGPFRNPYEREEPTIHINFDNGVITDRNLGDLISIVRRVMENVRKRIIRDTSDGFDGFDDDIDSLNIDSVDLKGEDIANQIVLATEDKSAEKETKAADAANLKEAQVKLLKENLAKLQENMAKLHHDKLMEQVQKVQPSQKHFPPSEQNPIVQTSPPETPTGPLPGPLPDPLSEPPQEVETGRKKELTPEPPSKPPQEVETGREKTDRDQTEPQPEVEAPVEAPGYRPTTRTAAKTSVDAQFRGARYLKVVPGNPFDAPDDELGFGDEQTNPKSGLSQLLQPVPGRGGRNPFTLKRKKGNRKEKKRRFAKHKHSFNLNKQKKKSKSSVKINY